jgi:hypothetical protein
MDAEYKYVNMSRFAAFQFGIDDAPDWFFNHEDVYTLRGVVYARTQRVKNRKLHEGEWVVLSTIGRISVVDDTMFKQWYAEIGLLPQVQEVD